MELHSMKALGGSRRRKRVARGPGSGLGKTAGRGHKGQMSRKGHKHKVGFEGGQMRLIRRIPKRGFTNPTNRTLAPVNVAALEQFDAGASITPEVLRECGLVKGVWDGVKILGDGELTKKLSVKAHGFSASARSKIEAAGGTCEAIGS